jgi:predicted membrane-bound dolichyl-phosphate-mannose-protein mannosyltransferase
MRIGGLSWLRRVDWIPFLLLLLIVVSFGLRLVWLDKPDGALIFDEAYYVNAVRVILGLPVGQDAPYHDAHPGLDPNTEHPPGAKLIIATAMRILGDNALGWRLPSVVFGTLSIALLYAIVRGAGGSKPIALLATFLYAFDNLVLVHSRIATLDIFQVALLLLGVYCYLAGWPIRAGLAFVTATLCKIGGMYGIGIIVLFEGLRFVRERIGSGRWRMSRWRRPLITIVVYAIALLFMLGILDQGWSSYKNPVEHLHHIFSYGLALTRPEGPQGQESNPWQWLLNEVPMTYLRVDEQVLVNGQIQVIRPTIFFRGAMNPYVIFITPLAIAFASYMAFKRCDDCSFLILAFFWANYGPFWPAAQLAHRISYIFYFLPTIPAVAIAAAQLLYDPRVPRVVRWTYIGGVLLGFYGYFPFRQVP